MTHRPVKSDAFRAALARFATGVTVVTTVAPDGTDHAMTANAFTSVSLDPPLVLVCVEKVARFHDAVIHNGHWGVSILAADGHRAAAWFATRGRPLAGQLDQFSYERGAVTGAALFTDALATLECRTTAKHDGGDHVIVVGEVISARVLRSDDPPLLYYESAYHALDRATGQIVGCVS